MTAASAGTKARTTSQGQGSRQSPDVRSLLGLREAAGHLGVRESFIRRLVLERRIPYYKLGRYLKFDPHELDAFVLRSRVEPSVSTPPPR